jgi:hypothetical protein
MYLVESSCTSNTPIPIAQLESIPMILQHATCIIFKYSNLIILHHLHALHLVTLKNMPIMPTHHT